MTTRPTPPIDVAALRQASRMRGAYASGALSKARAAARKHERDRIQALDAQEKALARTDRQARRQRGHHDVATDTPMERATQVLQRFYPAKMVHEALYAYPGDTWSTPQHQKIAKAHYLLMCKFAHVSPRAKPPKVSMRFTRRAGLDTLLATR